MAQNDIEKSLEELRGQVRVIDDDLVELLIRRAEVVREIGEFKKNNSLPIFDPERESFNIERNRKLAFNRLPEKMMDEFSDFLANWARELQKRLL